MFSSEIKPANEKDYFKLEVQKFERHERATDWLLFGMFGLFVVVLLVGLFSLVVEFGSEAKLSILIFNEIIWSVLFITLIWMSCVGHMKEREIIKHRIDFQKQGKIVKDIESTIKRLYFKKIIHSDSQNQTVDRRKEPGYDNMYTAAEKFIHRYKDEFLNTFNGNKSGFIKGRIYPHLKSKFPNYSKYPSNTQLSDENYVKWPK